MKELRFFLGTHSSPIIVMTIQLKVLPSHPESNVFICLECGQIGFCLLALLANDVLYSNSKKHFSVFILDNPLTTFNAVDHFLLFKVLFFFFTIPKHKISILSLENANYFLSVFILWTLILNYHLVLFSLALRFKNFIYSIQRSHSRS